VDSGLRTADVSSVDALSAVSWGSIAAGAVTAAAISLALIALGVGLGLSSISPWSDSGVSATTFKITTGVYLVLVAVMSSAIGGYLSARLRTKWTGLHTSEVFFRDTAHGLIAWAFATVISTTALGAATTHLVGGAAAGGGLGAQSATSSNPAQIYVDRLFRREASTPSSPAGAAGPDSGAAAGSPSASAAAQQGPNAQIRAEVTRLLTVSFQSSDDGLSSADRTYVARLVATQTGLSQADAEKRVDDVIQQAKAAADQARRNAAQFAFWMTATLLFGAFAAALAGAEGGQHRDGTWNEARLVPRDW
jgi:hypothetical protein